MKKVLLLIVATSLLSGCVIAPRPVDPYTRAAIIGAAQKQAMENAHDAAWGQDVYRHQEHRDSSRHGHHHNW